MKGNLELATLGGGCFWCLEAAYQQINGVQQVTSGYAGGHIASPSYEQVCSGVTGHAEVVQLSFDAAVLTYAELLDIFWVIHNPTTLNQQGNDIGHQYRSVIFYHNANQRQQAVQSRSGIARLWDAPIVTEIQSLPQFYAAEAYHQNYFERNPNLAYCQAVINPKLAKLRQQFTSRLKPSP